MVEGSVWRGVWCRSPQALSWTGGWPRRVQGEVFERVLRRNPPARPETSCCGAHDDRTRALVPELRVGMPPDGPGSMPASSSPGPRIGPRNERSNTRVKLISVCGSVAACTGVPGLAMWVSSTSTWIRDVRAGSRRLAQRSQGFRGVESCTFRCAFTVSSVLLFKEDGRGACDEPGGWGLELCRCLSGSHPPGSQARPPSLEGGRKKWKPEDGRDLVD
jgi:hypothetical protein